MWQFLFLRAYWDIVSNKPVRLRIETSGEGRGGWRAFTSKIPINRWAETINEATNGLNRNITGNYRKGASDWWLMKTPPHADATTQRACWSHPKKCGRGGGASAGALK